VSNSSLGSNVGLSHLLVSGEIFLIDDTFWPNTHEANEAKIRLPMIELLSINVFSFMIYLLAGRCEVVACSDQERLGYSNAEMNGSGSHAGECYNISFFF
jgi:hypothetical protein